MAQTAQAHVQEVHSAPKGEGEQAIISREFLIAKDKDAGTERKADIGFPVKFKSGHRCNANEAAQLTAHYLRQFTNNMNAACERQKKVYTPEEVVALWNAYELGAPREGTGQTLHDQAVEAYAREAAEKQGKAWPTAGAVLKAQGISIRKATEAQKEAAQAKADTLVADVLAKTAASTREATVAGIKRHEDALRAKREAAKASVAPTAMVDSADIEV
jgi:hypothetical protein